MGGPSGQGQSLPEGLDQGDEAEGAATAAGASPRWFGGAEELEGKLAILDVPLGKGRVVAFNFDPIHRLVTRSDFGLLWNPILNWNDLPPPRLEAASGAGPGSGRR